LQYFTGGQSYFNVSSTGIKCFPRHIKYDTHYYSIPQLDTMPICNYINQNNCPIAWKVRGKTYFESDNNCSTIDSSLIHGITCLIV
jgi:hypothetical protein